ncbi:type II toxin-antitoxin system VapC family toxin [Actinomycetospora endophytica]|uniref:Ribonuclease VapC n=1 Tax=Actinomycetospora endophytica TaxID=2291215 RepID=A0ABS8PHM6_9PSEU|nr:type II toxin-antitoxin system VapC family toxin [Actinomycetospora endophytica]MCD2197000.1 type II toxin-antitoxin system VapC family toxin [Actinomycetospora endophytica]
MIVDSSAVIAVLRTEDDAHSYHDTLLRAGGGRISAANYVETALVVDGRGDPVMSHELDRYLSTMRVEVVALTPEQARLARAAHRDYGRGSGHRARLNLGDCFAYALAKDLDEPLLYKGDDFVHTDVIAAVPR